MSEDAFRKACRIAINELRLESLKHANAPDVITTSFVNSIKEDLRQATPEVRAELAHARAYVGAMEQREHELKTKTLLGRFIAKVEEYALAHVGGLPLDEMNCDFGDTIFNGCWMQFINGLQSEDSQAVLNGLLGIFYRVKKEAEGKTTLVQEFINGIEQLAARRVDCPFGEDPLLEEEWQRFLIAIALDDSEEILMQLHLILIAGKYEAVNALQH